MRSGRPCQTGLKSKSSREMRTGIGGPGRDRTGDLFHAMEARSQLRHRPTIESRKAEARRVGIEGSTEFIFAHIARIVNASSILLFVSTGLFWHN